LKRKIGIILQQLSFISEKNVTINSQLIISLVYSESGHEIFICFRGHPNYDSRKKKMTGFFSGGGAHRPVIH
jgi:hypothetical protein